MLTKFISFLLICLMMSVSSSTTAFAGIASDKKNDKKNARKIAKREAKIKKRAAKIKKAITKLGAGKDSVVKVKLRDKTKIKGYVSQIGENSFTVVDKKGNNTVVEYNKAKQVKGNNLSTGVWVAIGVGVALVVLILIARAVLPGPDD